MDTKVMFGRSQSAAQETSGGKQLFNERHSRDKIENFLKELEAKETGKGQIVKEAWEEYRCLMKNEKILAYKHPKQFFENLKNPERGKKRHKMRLNQSPLSKLIASNVKSEWVKGAEIQFESLQASDQKLMDIMMADINYLEGKQQNADSTPNDSELDLYPEGCDEFAKPSIINLLHITEEENTLNASCKKEYIKLVCKEATLQKEFPNQYKRNIHGLLRNKDLDAVHVSEYDKKVPQKGPLYYFIREYTVGNKEVMAKRSLREYYILSMAESVLLQCDPNSEWTFSYPDEIQRSSHSDSTGTHEMLTQKSLQNCSLSKSVRSKPDYLLQLGDIHMAGTYPLPSKNVLQNMMTEDEKRASIKSSDNESGRKVLQKQNKIHGYEDQNQVPVGKDTQTRPPRKALGRQNSNSRSEAFGTIPEPGDVNVTHWREAYSDLHKSWSYQKSQIEELTNRLSSFASKQLTEGNAAFTDLSDKNRPTKIGEKFGLIFDDEWSEVFEELKDEGLNDEIVICKLQEMVQYGFKFCQKKAAEQLSDLECSMKIPILQPFHMKQSLHVPKDMVKTLTSATSKHAKEYRKFTASISTPEVCKVFFKEESEFLQRTFPQCSSGSKLKDYINVCIEQMWLMCVQDPQMSLGFAASGQPFDKELYKFYEKKGGVVHLTVWPVVYLHDGGPIISKGYVLPK